MSRAAGDATVVDVWRVALDATRPPSAAALASLEPWEHERAAKFATDTLRHRWLGAHVALRHLLADALGVAPATITYGKGPQGKRFIAAPAAQGLEFNFSDSGDLALVALARGGPIGADIEARRAQPDLAAVAESHFSVEERQALLALDSAEQLAAFYRLWTRKEAYLKALGAGLGYGLGRFAVTMDAEDARLVHVDGDHRVAASWRIAVVAAPEGYEACVAAPWPFAAIRVHDLDVRRLD